MTSSFTIQSDGFEEAIALVDEISNRAETWGTSEVGRDLMLLVQADVDERFNSAPDVESGGLVYGGVVWKPVTEAYLNANPRRIGGKLLRDTGELLQSFTIGAPGNIVRQSPQEIEFGSALPKARGLDNDRPLVVVHDELTDGVSVLLLDFLVRE